MFINDAMNFYKMYWKVLNRKTAVIKACSLIGSKVFGGSYDKYHRYVLNKLSGEFKDIINNYKTSEVICDDNDSKDIWMFWLQGKENMPSVVKRCYDNACKNFPDYNVHLISKDNYIDYVDVPEIILDKVDKGIISITHFSDILRVKLLRNHGGFWMDATLFSTSNKPLPKTSFTTIKTPNKWGGGRRLMVGTSSF